MKQKQPKAYLIFISGRFFSFDLQMLLTKHFQFKGFLNEENVSPFIKRQFLS